MEFCQKCGGMILVSDKKIACASCGYKPKKKPIMKVTEKITKHESVAVVKKEENINPVIEIECKKCKNDKAYFWTTQTRGGDESETKFYKCTKCNHSWRAYR